MKAIIYIHGKGGTSEEAKHYEVLFPEYKVFGFDYKANTPWDAQKEFSEYSDQISDDYENINLIANSIGAYFSLCSLGKKKITKAFFVSPIVDMERLICDMMQWANVTEHQLENAGTIEIGFGETLSWEYFSWVRNNPIVWKVPTKILYGKNDNLQSIEVIKTFSDKIGAELTIMKNGEHWFHTDEQIAFLDNWIVGKL
jgi:hypothetical protein